VNPPPDYRAALATIATMGALIVGLLTGILVGLLFLVERVERIADGICGVSC
jgi:hypothetical protein